MSDIPDDYTIPEPRPQNGWLKVYHPRGVQVTLPVFGVAECFDYAVAFANVGAALDAGFLLTAPGLDEGEEKEEIGYVLHALHERDGETTPVAVLYASNDALTWPILKVYLNKKSDVEAFEYASKMKLASMPEYVGNDRPQRGAGQKTDRFIIKVPKPFGVVFKKNPKHDDTEAGKMKPARLFVRWADTKPATEQPEQKSDGIDAAVLAEIDVRLAADPTVENINDDMLPWLRKKGRETAIAGFEKIKARLLTHGVRWDGERRIFVVPAKANNAEFDEFAGSTP